MDILKPILDIYDVKKDVLLFYLDDKIKREVENLDYLEDDNELFLNDKVYIINRSTLELEHNGIIQAIKEGNSYNESQKHICCSLSYKQLSCIY